MKKAFTAITPESCLEFSQISRKFSEGFFLVPGDFLTLQKNLNNYHSYIIFINEKRLENTFVKKIKHLKTLIGACHDEKYINMNDVY